jgi:hypothetical protein
MGLRNALRQVPIGHRPNQTLAVLESQYMCLDVDTIDSEMLTWLHSLSFNLAAARITLEALSGLRVEFKKKDVLRVQLDKALDIHLAKCKANGSENTVLERCVRASMHLRDPMLTQWPQKWWDIPAVQKFARSLSTNNHSYVYQQALSLGNEFTSPVAVAFMVHAISSKTSIQLHPIVWSELLELPEWWFRKGRDSLTSQGYVGIGDLTNEIQKEGLLLLCQLVSHNKAVFEQVGSLIQWKSGNAGVPVDLQGYLSAASSHQAEGFIRCFIAIFCWDCRSDMPNNCAKLIGDFMKCKKVCIFSI